MDKETHSYIKFYGKNDYSIGIMLEKAEPLITSFDNTCASKNINEVLELYNIQELFSLEVRLKKWSDVQYKEYQKVVSDFTKAIGKFFSKIDDSSFSKYSAIVKTIYIEDFWKLFSDYKLFKRISAEKILEYLSKKKGQLYVILKHEKIVKHYDEYLSSFMRNSEQSAPILIDKFLKSKNGEQYYIPKSLLPGEFEILFIKYIDSEKASANNLQLLFESNGTKECPISDTVKLKAKRAYETFWKKHAKVALEYGVAVSFAKQEALVEHHQTERAFSFSYSLEWVKENTDYPTILNNFTYMFEMLDLCWRISLVSVKSEISIMEAIFGVAGKKIYPTGMVFNEKANLSHLQTQLYYDFLNEYGINLEDVFKWFFEIYLPEEFDVQGFSMAVSTANTYLEKSGTLVSEMDGILKQFRMFVQDGKIDREKYEISSEHLKIKSIPSLVSNKYAYAESKELTQEMDFLFSTQTVLSYTKRIEGKYDTLFELLQNEEVSSDDFFEDQITCINWLVERGSLVCLENGTVCLNQKKTVLLKDLYTHEVLCPRFCGQYSGIELEKMIGNGDLVVENTLFSRPEQDYLNYQLNKAEFSNGLDLKNIYSHGTRPQGEEKNQYNYIELLKIMVLIITKINAEFCQRDEDLHEGKRIIHEN